MRPIGPESAIAAICGRRRERQESAMKYMLMMNSPLDGYETYLSWPKKVLEANVAFMSDFTRKLRESGELVGAEGLGSPRQAKLVRRSDDGTLVTDGVFAESKEFLAGYWIVDVENERRALEIAGEASRAPGLGEKPLEIEVRAVLSSHKDLG
jgi:hypothetical protein